MAELSKEQWVPLLKSTKFFETFESHEIDKIIQYADLLHYPMHHYIIKEKDMDCSFYVIVKGNANVIRKNRNSGPPEKLLSINSGECFGEMAVITKQPRTNFIIAGSDCYVVRINGATIDKIDEHIQLKLYKQFAYNLIKRLQKP